MVTEKNRKKNAAGVTYKLSDIEDFNLRKRKLTDWEAEDEEIYGGKYFSWFSLEDFFNAIIPYLCIDGIEYNEWDKLLEDNPSIDVNTIKLNRQGVFITPPYLHMLGCLLMNKEEVTPLYNKPMKEILEYTEFAYSTVISNLLFDMISEDEQGMQLNDCYIRLGRYTFIHFFGYLPMEMTFADEESKDKFISDENRYLCGLLSDELLLSVKSSSLFYEILYIKDGYTTIKEKELIKLGGLQRVFEKYTPTTGSTRYTLYDEDDMDKIFIKRKVEDDLFDEYYKD